MLLCIYLSRLVHSKTTFAMRLSLAPLPKLLRMIPTGLPSKIQKENHEKYMIYYYIILLSVAVEQRDLLIYGHPKQLVYMI